MLLILAEHCMQVLISSMPIFNSGCSRRIQQSLLGLPAPCNVPYLCAGGTGIFGLIANPRSAVAFSVMAVKLGSVRHQYEEEKLVLCEDLNNRSAQVVFVFHKPAKNSSGAYPVQHLRISSALLETAAFCWPSLHLQSTN